MGKKTRLTIQILVASLFVMLTTVFLFTDSFGFRQTRATIDTSELEDGYYIGSDNGYGGEIKVEVAIEEGEILDIAILEHEETEGVADPAFEEIPEEMINTNSSDVDIVSGATMTSEGLIAAVNDALSSDPNEDSEVTEDDDDAEDGEEEEEIEAMTFDMDDGTYEGTAEGHNGPLTLEVSLEDGEITDIVILEHEETEDASDPAFEEIPDKIIEHQSTKVDVVTGVTVSSDAIKSAVEDALGLGRLDTEYIDGTYEGTAEGHNDPLTAEVTVEEGKISAVEITEHNETEGLAEPALEEVSEAIVDKNRPDVDYDIVSGATVTSEAVIEAVSNALEDAEK
ncbi:MAG: FMN-binding protein [Atopostipes sp.]|nr:FMN-binding protein [Atopostipes sp.]